MGNRYGDLVFVSLNTLARIAQCVQNSASTRIRLLRWISPLYYAAASEARAFDPRCSRKLQVPSYQVVERPHLTSTCIPPFLPPRSHDLEIAMSVNFTRLWKKARAAPNETEFVRSLAEILSSRDGRKFILTLNQEDAEQCIEIMDQVRSPHLYYS